MQVLSGIPGRKRVLAAVAYNVRVVIRCKNGSKRLTETLFDWSAIGAAQPYPFPTLENDLELSVRNRLQMRDACEIHNRRAMDSYEVAWVQLCFHVRKG